MGEGLDSNLISAGFVRSTPPLAMPKRRKLTLLEQLAGVADPTPTDVDPDTLDTLGQPEVAPFCAGCLSHLRPAS